MVPKAVTTTSAAGNESSMNSSRDQGFTLLELMIVVLVVALVLAVSYPSMLRGSTALHLRATGRDVLNTFRIAREKAVTEQIRMMVTVDPATQKLVLSDDLGDNARTYLLPRDVKIRRITRAGAEILQGPLVVRFLPNGSSDNAEITLESDAGAFLRIISDPITGGARIESGQGRNLP
jgi:prepilin-type N-terminal cleavage/methylation domain-containing protein